MNRSRLAAAAAVVSLAGCVVGPPNGDPAALRARLATSLEGAVRLYDSGEFAMASGHFADAARLAGEIGDWRLALQVKSAECTSWLLARRLIDFDECALHLEGYQRRAHETSPGTNALVAFGAVAGARPVPSVKIPNPVAPVVFASEGAR